MLFYVKVKPGSKQEKIERVDGNNLILSVKARAMEGKANAAVIESLSDYFDTAKSRITIMKGHKGRNKVVEVI